MEVFIVSAFSSRSASFVAALAATAVLTAAQGRKLSSPVQTSVVGDVYSVLSSPDGEWIVYSADQEIDDVGHLYSVPAKGGHAPIQLDDLPHGSFPWSFFISPDSRSVVFASLYDLYAVPIDGSGGPIQLDRTESPHDFLFTPDGTSIVYVASLLDGGRELFLAPLDGDGPRRLGAELPDETIWFQIDPLGRRVVYMAKGELWSVGIQSSGPIHGGAGPVRLNGPLPTGGHVERLQITPDAGRVVFWGDCAVNGQFELFLVPIEGGVPRRLGAPPAVAGRDIEGDFAITPDGTHAVYRANHGVSSGVRDLYSVPLDGSRPAVKLTALAPRAEIFSFQVDPTSRQVVYRANEGFDEPVQLFVAPLDGSTEPRRLNDPLVEGPVLNFGIDPAGETAVFMVGHELYAASLRTAFLVQLDRRIPGTLWSSFRISSDSRYVVLPVHTGLASELFRIAIDGKEDPIPLSPPFHSIQSFTLHPVDDRVHFVADLEVLDAFELFTVPIEGGAAPVKLSGPMATVTADPLPVSGFEFVPARDEAVFRIDGCDDECWEGATADELHRVRTDGTRPPQRMYPAPQVPLDDIGAYRFGPDGSRMVFLAGDGGEYSFYELYSVPFDGSEPPVRLDATIQGYAEGVGGFEITPDGTRVVFRAGDLYVVPIEGGPPTELASFDDDGLDVIWFGLDRNGTNAVFVVYDHQNHWLYGVPLDGSQPAVPLDGPRSPGIQHFDVQITADGTRVVYRVGPYWGPAELLSVPVDGSSAPVSLGGSLVAGGSFGPSRLSPGGDRVVFVADRETDEVHELFSVPVDGSSGPVKLSGALVPGGDVGGQDRDSFSIGPDGSLVVYTADQASDEVVELFAVPIDGSTSPVKLSGALVGGGDVGGTFGRSFAISADGVRVVYIADQTTNDVFELMSVPLDGSASPTKLSGPLVAGGDVAEVPGFALAPDGNSVLYVADQRTDGVDELFRAALDGSGSPTRLNGPLVADGDVASFRVSPDSSRVLYLADQDVNGLLELYVSFLTLPQHRPERVR